MKFYGWNELIAAFKAGQDAFLKLMNSDSLIAISGYAWGLGKTADETHYVVIIKPQMIVLPDHNWPTVKFHGFIDKNRKDKSIRELVAIDEWNYRMDAGVRTHVIGKIAEFDYEKNEIHLELLEDMSFSELESHPSDVESEMDFIDNSIISAEYLKIYEREKNRHDLFLTRYVELTALNSDESMVKDQYTKCGNPLPESSETEIIRKTLDIPEDDKIYFYAYDSLAITTSGIFIRGFEKSLFGKIGQGYFSWERLASNAYAADEYRNEISDLFYLDKALFSTTLCIRGNNKESIGIDTKKDVKNKYLPKGLNIFVKEVLKGFAGMRRRDNDIQVLNVDDDIQTMNENNQSVNAANQVVSDDSSRSKDLKDAFTTQDAIIKLWGKDFILTAEMKNTMLIFKPRAILDKVADDYIKKLQNQPLTLKQFCEKEAQKVMSEVIMPHCEPFVYLINQAGVYNVDLEIFWKRYYVPKYLAPWEELYDFLVDCYNEILERGQKEIDLYEMQKQSRARIRGGGFGLVGAAKGILTAGAINALTGVAYDVRNRGKEDKTKQKMSYLMNNIISHPEIEEKIRLALKASLYNIIYAVREVIEERTEYRFLDLSDDVVMEVDATINTLIKMQIKDEQLEYEIMKLLQLNPYNQRIYHTAIAMHGDSDHDLDILATLTDVDIRGIRNQIFIDTYPKILQRYNDSDEAYETVTDWAIHLGVEEDDFLKILKLE